jgi:hypothetical protein
MPEARGNVLVRAEEISGAGAQIEAFAQQSIGIHVNLGRVGHSVTEESCCLTAWGCAGLYLNP